MQRPLHRQPARLLTLLALLSLASLLLALAIGPLAISVEDWLACLGWSDAPAPDYVRAAILQIRLPRALMALLIGAALAVAGAAMQGVFRNPLADPGLAGVSAGATLAATLWLALKPDWLAAWLPTAFVLPLMAFAGAAVAALAVLRLAQHEGHTSIATLLLAGLAINAMAMAGVGVLQQLASDASLRDITLWMFGSLGKSGWPQIAAAAPLLLLAILLIPRSALALDALLLGEAEAGHLGVDVERLKRRLLLLIVLAVGASVALAGSIGFIGLLAPHLVRLIAGPGHRLLLPASALTGSILLLLADTAARSLVAPLELPVGVLTSLLGAPFFLWLLTRARSRAELF